MKIAFVSQPLDRVVPPSMNSIGIWTYEVSRRLAKTNDVTVYTRGGLIPGPGIGQGVKTRFIRSLSNRWAAKLSHSMERYASTRQPFFASWLNHFEYSLQVAISAMLQRAEVIHIQNYSQFVPIIRAFNPKAKIALHMRCEWLTQLDHEMIARRLEKTDLIFGVSDYITNQIRNAYPEHARKCFSVVNGVDVTEFTNPPQPGPGTSERTILMVGRVSPEKGVHVLVDAFCQIADRFPDVRLVIVGPGGSVNKGFIVELSEDSRVQGLEKFYQGGRTYYHHFMSQVPEAIQKRIQFTGAVGYYKTIHYYQTSQILANPSLSESFGRSIIEANACGLPVVAARTGGMVELVEDGVNGLLVEPGDAQSLASALARLLEDEPLRQRMSIKGRQKALNQYNWERVCQDLLNAYKGTPKTVQQNAEFREPMRIDKA